MKPKKPAGPDHAFARCLHHLDFKFRLGEGRQPLVSVTFFADLGSTWMSVTIYGETKSAAPRVIDRLLDPVELQEGDRGYFEAMARLVINENPPAIGTFTVGSGGVGGSSTSLHVGTFTAGASGVAYVQGCASPINLQAGDSLTITKVVKVTP